jgi:hypothetical protein
MTETSPTLENEEPEALRRRRGCIRPLIWGFLVGAIVLLLVLFFSWIYTGTEGFARFVATKIEANLEARLGRDVQIGRVTIVRGRVTSVILEDVRIANVEGATHPWFAIAPRVVIIGGVESFLQRIVRVGSVEVIGAEVFFEIFPEGAPLDHNWPVWRRAEPRRFQIVRMEMQEIAVRDARFDFLDRRRDLHADLREIDARIDPNVPEGIYTGIGGSRLATIRYAEWDPVAVELRSEFRYVGGRLLLHDARVRGEGMSLDLAGAILPRGEARYDLDIRGSVALERLQEVMNLEQELRGPVFLDTRLRGQSGRFLLGGDLRSPSLSAAGYDLEDLRATLSIRQDRALVEIASAGYAGGTVTGTWRMTSYRDPGPMRVDLRYQGVSLEGLLASWEMEATGLRGSIRGELRYEFTREAILRGTGSGLAVLEPGAVAFGDAPHPMRVAGRTEFGIRDGVLRFRDPSTLQLPRTAVRFSGTLVLEDRVTDLALDIDSEDIGELDRLAVNFARSLGNRDFDLLGLGGRGTIRGRVRGPLGEPVVSAVIDARDARYNDVLLGRADLDITWDGATERLRFNRARFSKADATMLMSGTIRFPEGADPVFDLAIESRNWVVQEAFDLLNLELEGVGRATGNLTVTGTAEAGRVRFDDLVIREGGSQLTLSGDLRWLPGEGNIAFDLAIDAVDWPVQEAIDMVNLDLYGVGRATGRLSVTGTAQSGTVRFSDLTIRENGSRLTLAGDVRWLPGEGNVVFNLDLAAENFPVQEIAAFLDLGDLPVTGDLTGTLHLEGHREELEGAGSVVVRRGTIYGEPVESAVADIVFESGRLEIPHFEIVAPAGTVIGEATFDFATEEFAYLIQPTEIDLTRLERFRALSDLFGGRLRIVTSGAGTLTQPELVLEATLLDGALRGEAVPPTEDPPRLYIAMRGGQMIIRGSAFETLSIEGEGRISETGELDGEVVILISDLERLMAFVDPYNDTPLAGSIRAELDLGGNMRALETLEIEGAITEMTLRVAGEDISPLDPITFALAGGALQLDRVTIRTQETNFVVDGTISLVDQQEINIRAEGDVDLRMLQLFLADVTTSGILTVQAEVLGSITAPRVTGTAEIRDGSVRIAELPQTISDIFGSFVFRSNLVEINAFRATMGGGTIVAGGFVTHQGLDIGRIQLNVLEGENVTLRYYEGVTLTGDFKLTLTGDVEQLALVGTLTVDRAVYSRDFDVTQAILQRLLERQTVIPRIAASWQDRISLDIRVGAEDSLAVDNNIANLTGSAILDVRGTLANPIILGRVDVNEGGTITFQDVNYRVTRGTISFQNPFRNDPYLDITAEGTLKSRGATLGDIQEYELTVNLTGTVDRITPNISSDPPIGDITLLTLLAGGIGGDPSLPLTARAFSEAGTSLVLTQIGEAIGTRILPFADTVRLDTIEGRSGFVPTVTFEKQISENLYMIVIYDTASAENVEIIQWQVGRDWVIQFTRDSEKADTFIINAIDGRFRRRYEGRW